LTQINSLWALDWWPSGQRPAW